MCGAAMSVPLTIYQLGSGSRGNATVIAGPAGSLLVDAGFSGKELARRAEMVGCKLEAIRAIVVTHGHDDHIRGAGVLSRRLGVPVWGTSATLRSRRGLRGDEPRSTLPRHGTVSIAGLEVASWPAKHDKPGTVILRIAGRVGLATDLGHAGPAERDFLSGLDMLLLEFNHDKERLLAGDDPPWLKQRIMSDRGHLSNDQAAELLQSPGFAPPRQALVLGHLSERNNTPQLALAAARAAVAGLPVAVQCSCQSRPLAPMVLK